MPIPSLTPSAADRAAKAAASSAEQLASNARPLQDINFLPPLQHRSQSKSGVVLGPHFEKVMKANVAKVTLSCLGSTARPVYYNCVMNKLLKVWNKDDFIDDDMMEISMEEGKMEGPIDSCMLDWLLVGQDTSNRLPSSRFAHQKSSAMSVHVPRLIFNVRPPHHNIANVMDFVKQVRSVYDLPLPDIDVDEEREVCFSLHEMIVKKRFVHGELNRYGDSMMSLFDMEIGLMEITTSLPSHDLEEQYKVHMLSCVIDSNSGSHSGGKGDSDRNERGRTRERSASKGDREKEKERRPSTPKGGNDHAGISGEAAEDERNRKALFQTRINDLELNGNGLGDSNGGGSSRSLSMTRSMSRSRVWDESDKEEGKGNNGGKGGLSGDDLSRRNTTGSVWRFEQFFISFFLGPSKMQFETCRCRQMLIDLTNTIYYIPTSVNKKSKKERGEKVTRGRERSETISSTNTNLPTSIAGSSSSPLTPGSVSGLVSVSADSLAVCVAGESHIVVEGPDSCIVPQHRPFSMSNSPPQTPIPLARSLIPTASKATPPSGSSASSGPAVLTPLQLPIHTVSSAEKTPIVTPWALTRTRSPSKGIGANSTKGKATPGKEKPEDNAKALRSRHLFLSLNNLAVSWEGPAMKVLIGPMHVNASPAAAMKFLVSFAMIRRTADRITARMEMMKWAVHPVHMPFVEKEKPKDSMQVTISDCTVIVSTNPGNPHSTIEEMLLREEQQAQASGMGVGLGLGFAMPSRSRANSSNLADDDDLSYVSIGSGSVASGSNPMTTGNSAKRNRDRANSSGGSTPGNRPRTASSGSVNSSGRKRKAGAMGAVSGNSSVGGNTTTTSGSNSIATEEEDRTRFMVLKFAQLTHFTSEERQSYGFAQLEVGLNTFPKKSFVTMRKCLYEKIKQMPVLTPPTSANSRYGPRSGTSREANTPSSPPLTLMNLTVDMFEIQMHPKMEIGPAIDSLLQQDAAYKIATTLLTSQQEKEQENPHLIYDLDNLPPTDGLGIEISDVDVEDVDDNDGEEVENPHNRSAYFDYSHFDGPSMIQGHPGESTGRYLDGDSSFLSGEDDILMWDAPVEGGDELGRGTSDYTAKPSNPTITKVVIGAFSMSLDGPFQNQYQQNLLLMEINGMNLLLDASTKSDDAIQDEIAIYDLGQELLLKDDEQTALDCFVAYQSIQGGMLTWTMKQLLVKLSSQEKPLVEAFNVKYAGPLYSAVAKDDRIATEHKLVHLIDTVLMDVRVPLEDCSDDDEDQDDDEVDEEGESIKTARTRMLRGVPVLADSMYVMLSRTTAPSKYYMDLELSGEFMCVNLYNTSMPCITAINAALEPCLPSNKEPSPTLPLWDTIRYLAHGEFSMKFHRLQVNKYTTIFLQTIQVSIVMIVPELHMDSDSLEFTCNHLTVETEITTKILPGRSRSGIRLKTTVDKTSLCSIPCFVISIKHSHNDIYTAMTDCLHSSSASEKTGRGSSPPPTNQTVSHRVYNHHDVYLRPALDMEAMFPSPVVEDSGKQRGRNESRSKSRQHDKHRGGVKLEVDDSSGPDGDSGTSDVGQSSSNFGLIGANEEELVKYCVNNEYVDKLKFQYNDRFFYFRSRPMTIKWDIEMRLANFSDSATSRNNPIVMNLRLDTFVRVLDVFTSPSDDANQQGPSPTPSAKMPARQNGSLKVNVSTKTNPGQSSPTQSTSANLNPALAIKTFGVKRPLCEELPIGMLLNQIDIQCIVNRFVLSSWISPSNCGGIAIIQELTDMQIRMQRHSLLQINDDQSNSANASVASGTSGSTTKKKSALPTPGSGARGYGSVMALSANNEHSLPYRLHQLQIGLMKQASTPLTLGAKYSAATIALSFPMRVDHLFVDIFFTDLYVRDWNLLLAKPDGADDTASVPDPMAPNMPPLQSRTSLFRRMTSPSLKEDAIPMMDDGLPFSPNMSTKSGVGGPGSSKDAKNSINEPRSFEQLKELMVPIHKMVHASKIIVSISPTGTVANRADNFRSTGILLRRDEMDPSGAAHSCEKMQTDGMTTPSAKLPFSTAQPGPSGKFTSSTPLPSAIDKDKSRKSSFMIGKEWRRKTTGGSVIMSPEVAMRRSLTAMRRSKQLHRKFESLGPRASGRHSSGGIVGVNPESILASRDRGRSMLLKSPESSDIPMRGSTSPMRSRSPLNNAAFDRAGSLRQQHTVSFNVAGAIAGADATGKDNVLESLFQKRRASMVLPKGVSPIGGSQGRSTSPVPRPVRRWDPEVDGYRASLRNFIANHAAFTPPQTSLPVSYRGYRRNGSTHRPTSQDFRNHDHDNQTSSLGSNIWGLKVVDVRILFTIGIRDCLFLYVSRCMDLFSSKSTGDGTDTPTSDGAKGPSVGVNKGVELSEGSNTSRQRRGSIGMGVAKPKATLKDFMSVDDRLVDKSPSAKGTKRMKKSSSSKKASQDSPPNTTEGDAALAGVLSDGATNSPKLKKAKKQVNIDPSVPSSNGFGEDRLSIDPEIVHGDIRGSSVAMHLGISPKNVQAPSPNGVSKPAPLTTTNSTVAGGTDDEELLPLMTEASMDSVLQPKRKRLDRQSFDRGGRGIKRSNAMRRGSLFSKSIDFRVNAKVEDDSLADSASPNAPTTAASTKDANPSSTTGKRKGSSSTGQGSGKGSGKTSGSSSQSANKKPRTRRRPLIETYFEVEIVEPQINFLDDRTHSSLIIVAGNSKLSGQRMNTAMVPKSLSLDGKQLEPQRRQELRLQMEGVSAYTVPTVPPGAAAAADSDDEGAQVVLQDEVHWKHMKSFTDKLQRDKSNPAASTAVDKIMMSTGDYGKILLSKGESSESPMLKAAIHNFQIRALYIFWTDVDAVEARNMHIQQAREDLICTFRLELPDLSVEIVSWQFYVILNVIRNVLLVPPPILPGGKHSSRAETEETENNKVLEVQRNRALMEQHELRVNFNNPLDIVKQVCRDELKILIEDSLNTALQLDISSQGTARYVEVFIGKMTWALRTSTAGTDMMANTVVSADNGPRPTNFESDDRVVTEFFGIYATLEFSENRCITSSFEIQRFWAMNLSPGRDSLAFPDPRHVVFPILLERDFCTHCNRQFDMEDNTSTACTFHADQDGNRGEFKEVTIIDDLSKQVTRSKMWTCCGQTNEFSVGCSARPHTCKEVMIAIRAEANPTTRVENVDVSVLKTLEISIFPGATYNLRLQLTKSLSELLHRYFSIDNAFDALDRESSGLALKSEKEKSMKGEGSEGQLTEGESSTELAGTGRDSVSSVSNSAAVDASSKDASKDKDGSKDGGKSKSESRSIIPKSVSSFFSKHKEKDKTTTAERESLTDGHNIDSDRELSNVRRSSVSSPTEKRNARPRSVRFSTSVDISSHPNGATIETDNGETNALTSTSMSTKIYATDNTRDSAALAAYNKKKRQQECVYVRYLRVGEINLDVSTAGFAINFDNIKAVMTPYYCRKEVHEWKRLIFMIERHLGWSLTKTTASSGLSKIGKMLGFTKSTTLSSSSTPPIIANAAAALSLPHALRSFAFAAGGAHDEEQVTQLKKSMLLGSPPTKQSKQSIKSRVRNSLIILNGGTPGSTGSGTNTGATAGSKAAMLLGGRRGSTGSSEAIASPQPLYPPLSVSSVEYNGENENQQNNGVKGGSEQGSDGDQMQGLSTKLFEAVPSPVPSAPSVGQETGIAAMGKASSSSIAPVVSKPNASLSALFGTVDDDNWDGDI